METFPNSIQSYYGEEYSHCFGCGKKHPSGLHLDSYLQPDGTAVMRLVPPSEYTGGVPDNLYGGFIAMLFDCHGTAAAAGFYLNEHKRTLSKEHLERFVTAHLEVDFLRPTPMQQEVSITAAPLEVTERKVILSLSLTTGGEECARGKMVAVRFVPKK